MSRGKSIMSNDRIAKIEMFKEITTEMLNLFDKKNRDYGNSFDISLDEDGLLVAKIRVGDKYKRFSQLIKNENLVKEESIRDTLVDMANYAIMTIMWMDNRDIKAAEKWIDDRKKIENGYSEGGTPDIYTTLKAKHDTMIDTMAIKEGIPIVATGGADMDGDVVRTNEKLDILLRELW